MTSQNSQNALYKYLFSRGTKLAPTAFLVSILLSATFTLSSRCQSESTADDGQMTSQQSSSDGPLLIINNDSSANTATPAQQIIVPRVGASFGDPSSIATPLSGGAFGTSLTPLSLAPYRWLAGSYNPYGGYAGLGHFSGYSPYIGRSFGSFTGGMAGVGLGLGMALGAGAFGGYGRYGGYRAIPGLGGFGGYSSFGSFGSLGGFGGLGSLISPLGGLGYGGYGGLGYGGYGGYGRPFGLGYGGMGYAGFGGMGYGGLGMGMGSSNPEFGRLTNTRVIQTAPSKPSGNYYAPSTVDSTASGSYYAGSSSTSLVFPTNRQSNQSQDYTKPQKNYWGSGGNPFPQDINSVPWAK